MDYGALPPEVNSGRIYSGSGSGSLRSAATAWDGLAAEMRSAAGSYRRVITDLTAGDWVGPASRSMASAVTPYMVWMSTTAAQCEQMATQVRVVAGAYDAAHAMSVPPTQVQVNRETARSLIQTNYWGRNVPAIMESEARYGEMWARDAGAMYEYSGTSVVATRQTTPFQAAPKTTLEGGLARQGAAVRGAADSALGTTAVNPGAGVIDKLQEMLEGGLPGSEIVGNPLDHMWEGAHLFGRWGSFLTSLAGHVEKSGAKAVSGAAGAALGSAARGGAAGLTRAGSAVSAGLGRATLVGAMSAPQSWATSVASATPAAATLSSAPSWASAGGATPGHMVGGLPAAAGMGGGRGMGNGVVKVGLRPFIMPRPPAAG